MESQYLKCDCDTSNSEIDVKNTKKFKPKTLYQNFYDVLKYSNYKVLKCYKFAFSIKSLTINIGSIIAIAYFLISSIFLIIFALKGQTQLKTDLSKNILENSWEYVIKKEKEKISEPIQTEENINNQKISKELITNENSLAKNKRQDKQGLRNVKRSNTNKLKSSDLLEYPPKRRSSVANIGKRKKRKSKTKISKRKSDNCILENNNNKAFISSLEVIGEVKENAKTYERKNKQNEDIVKFNKEEKEKFDNFELNELEI